MNFIAATVLPNGLACLPYFALFALFGRAVFFAKLFLNQTHDGQDGQLGMRVLRITLVRSIPIGAQRYAAAGRTEGSEFRRISDFLPAL